MINKLFKTTIFSLCAATFMSCGQQSKDNSAQTPMEFPQLTQQEITEGVLTPEVMLKLSRLSSTVLSPDKSTLVYSLSVQDVENNGSFSNLFSVNTKTNEAKQLTFGKNKYSSPQFSEDNSKIYFSSNKDGANQIWVMDIDGSNQKQISKVEGGVNGFSISPKADKLYYAKTVQVDKTAKDAYPQYKKAGAAIYDDLMVRHWDYWTDGSYSHIFVADIVNGTLSNDKDINEGESFDTPFAPYFPMEDITWNNAGTQIAYSSKKMTGKEYALNTNSDIYIYDIASGKTTNITQGLNGYDNVPVFSADDSKIAWISMERNGNEADKERLYVLDIASGAKTDLTKNFDNDAANITWDGNSIYFISPIQATHQLCRVDASGTKDIEILTDGLHDYLSIKLGEDKIFLEKATLNTPVDIVALDRTEFKETPVTQVNKYILDNIKMGEVQKRWIKTTDGKQMLTWVVLPPNFNPSEKYPTLLYCQGGPQSVVSQRWSYRWNLQAFAAKGYVIVAPNRRGLPSFGKEWNDQISGDYSGQNIRDYLSAIDEVSKESWVDKDRRGCVGASYGGYSAYFLAGNHNNRFKAFISHCGMFNLESFYGSTEELWFPTWDLGGPYWDKSNATAQKSYANSPHKFVDKWNAPILIIVGLKDYRIPYAESLQAFTAAKLKGLDARLLTFEDEGHQVFKPQNSLIWHNEFFGWLDKHLKK